MSDQSGPSSEAVIGRVVVPADLPLNKAVEAHQTILKAVEAAEGVLHVDLDGDEASVCALQLLIAAKRTADAESLELTLSDGAKAVLEQIDMT